MQCINKIKAGFTRSGDLTFSKKQADPSIVGIEFECRKCLPCRLNIAREKSVRAIKEAEMHKDNIFLTLTYDEENLKSPKLQYLDFQLFMKSLREKHTRHITDKELKEKLSISYMVTGEYGDKNKRPHWHAIIFNYRPSDQKTLRKTERGDTIYHSQELQSLWGKGLLEYGEVTIESAGYTARYAAKKLIHGKDGEHDYEPIHKTSSKNAIGKNWIEKHWQQTFELGYVRLPSGEPTKIPRYFTDWLKKNKPDEWRRYVTEKRLKIQSEAQKKNAIEEIEYLTECINRKQGWPMPITRNKMRLTILQQKFKKLQERLSL